MIVIIPCGGRKQDKVCKAGEMYTGPYHRACREYADTLVEPGRIFILSALYGLLTLDEEIAPYNLVMGDKGSVSPMKVVNQAEAKGILDEEAVALGGAKYIKVCQAVWDSCKTPLDGVGGIGKQLQWLKRNSKGIKG